MKTTRLSLLVISLIAVLSCNVINPAEDIPAYVYIDEFEMISQPGFGSTSEKISEIWVYANAGFIGAYDLPANIPVLSSGITDMSFRAGIRDNGIASTRVQYPFYTPFDVDLNLSPERTDTVVPQYTYKEGLPELPLHDDFESGTFFNDSDDSQAVFELTQDDSEVFEGNQAGKVFMDENATIFRAESEVFMDLPSNRQAYIELDYKCNNSFAIGLNAYDNSEVSKNLALILKETTDDSGVAQWNKIYIALLPITSINPNAEYFELYIESVKDEGNSTATLYFDNIKVIHF
ncbi:MAG: hypothetical protein ACPGED_12175 [Flavobacteriales bacterium]